MTDEQKELNRRIAEAKGWTYFEEDGILGMRDLNGVAHNILWPGLPDYAGSVDKALELVPDNLRCEITNYDPLAARFWPSAKWACSVDGLMWEMGDTMAEAICRAWLAWQESKKGA